MAYNQNKTAGRGNMLKTGRGIPTNMVNPIKQDEKVNNKTKEKVSARNNQAASDRVVEKAAAKKLKQKVKDVAGAGEHSRQRSLARGSQRGTFFGLEKLFD
jgi:peptide subunit release factor RF-3